MWTVLIILDILMLGCFLLTGLIRFLLAGFIFTLVFFTGKQEDKKKAENGRPLRKDRYAVRVIGSLLLCVFPFLMSPIAMRSKMLWQYQIQKPLLRVYNYVPKWFPDVTADVVSDFRSDHVASVMQGEGHESIRFVTTPERAAEYQRKFSEKAYYTAALPETYDAHITLPKEDMQKIPGYNDEWDNMLSFYCDRDFWYTNDTDGDPDAVIYFLDVHGNWNHPGSSAVIINTKTGAVELSQFGFTKLAYGE